MVQGKIYFNSSNKQKSFFGGVGGEGCSLKAFLVQPYILQCMYTQYVILTYSD